MKKATFFFFLLLYSSVLFSQFLGSMGDGFHMLSTGGIQINEQGFYNSGGIEDGFCEISFEGNSYPSGQFFAGSDGNGFDQFMIHSPLFGDYFFYLGSDHDGFDGNSLKSTINDQEDYFLGSNDDGFDQFSWDGYFFDNALYIGSTADGFDSDGSGTIGMGYGIWTGNINQNWNHPGNWTHSFIPDASTNVTIPAGRPAFPYIGDTLLVNIAGANYNCRRIDILPGALFRTLTGFRVRGIVNVWGDLVSNNSLDHSHIIENGGIITVDSSANLIIGNRPSGPALSDLVVSTGGKLQLYDGTINIDDQFNLLSGGTLTMTDGILYAHKFGEGSDLGGVHLSPIYIEAGAIVNITGGSVRVTGKNSANGMNAVQINEPGVIFMGQSQLLIRNGTSPNIYDCSISTVPGVAFQRVRINKPGSTVHVKSNLEIREQLILNPGSNLEIESGNTVDVTGH